MRRDRIRTARLGGNQQRLDEMEYFLEGLGRFLFGEEGEDFRKLARFVPRTRNLSALIDLGRVEGKGRDPAEDLRFLYEDLELRLGKAAPARAGDLRTGSAFFRYRRYGALLDQPEGLLDRVPPAQRLEVAQRIGRGVATLAPVLARLNAFAWLGVVGMPHLERELAGGEPPRLALEPPAPDAPLGLEELIATARGRVSPGLRRYFAAVHAELDADYRQQLARLAARTEKLA